MGGARTDRSKSGEVMPAVAGSGDQTTVFGVVVLFAYRRCERVAGAVSRGDVTHDQTVFASGSVMLRLFTALTSHSTPSHDSIVASQTFRLLALPLLDSRVNKDRPMTITERAETLARARRRGPRQRAESDSRYAASFVCATC